MSPLQVAVIAVPLSIKVAILVFRYLARRNLARNAAANAVNRVQVGADANGTPVYVTGTSKAVVDDVVRRYRETR